MSGREWSSPLRHDYLRRINCSYRFIGYRNTSPIKWHRLIPPALAWRLDRKAREAREIALFRELYQQFLKPSDLCFEVLKERMEEPGVDACAGR